MGPGARRDRLARQLTTAYGDGLLSPDTFAWRMDAVLSEPLVTPERVIGDLSVRVPRPRPAIRAIRAVVARLRALAAPAPDRTPTSLLALDWSGAVTELTIGRDPACDIVLDDEFVSRRHAQLTLRDGAWVLRDLASTNGCAVNGVAVQRCRLAPGDTLALGRQWLLVD